MNALKVAVGADHRGYFLKDSLLRQCSHVSWNDVGAYDEQPSDYPLFAKEVCTLLSDKKVDYGVLICGSGIGMSIAANRFPSIRAALVWNKEVAVQSRKEDDASILVLPADYIDGEAAVIIFNTWIKTAFLGYERYRRRIGMI